MLSCMKYFIHYNVNVWALGQPSHMPHPKDRPVCISKLPCNFWRGSSKTWAWSENSSSNFTCCVFVELVCNYGDASCWKLCLQLSSSCNAYNTSSQHTHTQHTHYQCSSAENHTSKGNAIDNYLADKFPALMETEDFSICHKIHHWTTFWASSHPLFL